MLKLLIVDDEPLVRRGIKSLVDFENLKIDQVIEAVNGEDALEKYEQHEPQLILADINMPKLDGLSFAEIVKKKAPSVKIALVTGYDYFDYAVQALKLGVDDYILKPISKKDIENVLKKLIQKLEQDRIQNTLVDHVIDQPANELEEMMAAHQYDMNFSLKKLADLLGYSSNHLSTVFKKQYGMTFQDYLIHVRIEKAKRLILTTDLKNYEIADQIGFNDVNYFGSRFKKIVGMSPKQYKEQVKSTDE